MKTVNMIRMTREDGSQAKVPLRGSPEAAGYDIRAFTPEAGGTYDVLPGCTVLISTGIRVDMLGTGLMMDIHGRSGLGSKQGIVLANCVGIIDPDYQGELLIAMRNHSVKTFYINDGERIAQLVFRQVEVVGFKEVTEFVTATDRGEGGFGSTGVK